MTALEIKCGAELVEFLPREIPLKHTTYTVLTGYETESGICFWCGKPLKRKAKHYCRGCMTQYYNHFNWSYASYEAKKRANYTCENCGEKGRSAWRFCTTPEDQRTNLRVHHIVPLKGAARFFSAYNLPWNLVVLCHTCHLEIHRIMNNHEKPIPLNDWDIAKAKGQTIMELLRR